MWKRSQGFVVSTLAMIALSGCVTRGSDFSSDLRWIKVKQTNKSEVSQRMGEPYQIGASAGQETWTYGRYNYRLIGEAKTKELKFWWTPDGKVDTYSFNSSYPEDKRAGVGQAAPGQTTAPAPANGPAVTH